MIGLGATEWILLLIIIFFVLGTIGILPLVWRDLRNIISKFWKRTKTKNKDAVDIFVSVTSKPRKFRSDLNAATLPTQSTQQEISTKDVAQHQMLTTTPGSQSQDWGRHHPEEPDMVNIPAGQFWMGSEHTSLEMAGLAWQDWMQDETPCYQLYLPTYAIGRYPVTNTEFARFIRDGGYRQPEFWTEVGWQAKELYGWTQPCFWVDKAWNRANYPLVGVSWYECVAYCRWLTKITGRFYRLPSEAEWEKAARGTDSYLWPWGNDWEADRCNSEEKGPGHTTPVEHYSPAGNSPYDVLNMAGNVWEWCATHWKKTYPYDITEDEWGRDYLAKTGMRMLRGGSWNSNKLSTRCACRLRFVPDDRNNYRGCRVIICQ